MLLFLLHVKINRREGYLGNFEGKERATICLSSGALGQLCSKVLRVSFLSVTRLTGSLQHIRHVPPHPQLYPCDSEREPFLQLRRLGFSITFPAALALLLPLPLPQDLFCSLKKKSVSLNFLLDRPHGETDRGLIRWYLFILLWGFTSPSLSQPTPRPAFNTSDPVADSVTGNVCSERLAWWQAADNEMEITLSTVPVWGS